MFDMKIIIVKQNMFYEQTLLNSPLFYDLHYILTSDLVNVNYVAVWRGANKHDKKPIILFKAAQIW